MSDEEEKISLPRKEEDLEIPWTVLPKKSRARNLKWSVGNSSYEIYTHTLKNTNKGDLFSHCLTIKSKVEQAVANQIHLGTSFFRAFS